MSQMDIVEILDDPQIILSETQDEEGLELLIEEPVAVETVELTEYIELPDSWVSVRTATVNPQFSMTGSLTVKVGDSAYPIAAGQWRITSILATLTTAAGTQSVIADVNINGVTVFTGSKVVFTPGAVVAAVGTWNNVTYTLGDVLTVDVDQIGSGGAPGDTLVLSILLERTN
jgi:hypothetical protein